VSKKNSFKVVKLFKATCVGQNSHSLSIVAGEMSEAISTWFEWKKTKYQKDTRKEPDKIEFEKLVYIGTKDEE